MNVLKWVYSAIVVSVVIALIGLFGQGKLSISQATADDAERTVHADIVKVEQTLSLVEFDLSKKAHLLRKTR